MACAGGCAYLIYKNWDDIVAYFERTWAGIKAAVPVDQWIDALGNKKNAFFAAVTGWWAGIDEWFGAKWGDQGREIKARFRGGDHEAAVPVDQWIDALGNKKTAFFAAVTGWWAGIDEWFGAKCGNQGRVPGRSVDRCPRQQEERVFRRRDGLVGGDRRMVRRDQWDRRARFSPSEGGDRQWFGAKWREIKAAFPVDQWIDALGNKKSAFFAAVTGWWAGIDEWFGAKWREIKAAFPVDQWIDALGNKKTAFFAAVTGWWAGIDEWFGAKWREIKAAFPVDQWIDALGNKKTAFFAAVTGWWAGIDEWFGAKWRAFVALIPEFIRDGLGIDVSPDGREASPHGAATPSLFAPSAAAGGRGSAIAGAREGNAHVTVDFRNMPRGTRTETRADSDTDLEVITGYAMQGAG